MPKRKNGGGEYKKVKGSSGSSSPKTRTVSQPSQTMVTPPMPIAPNLFRPQKYQQLEEPIGLYERGTPLQPRQSFDIKETQKPETMPFRNTDIERLKELGKRLGASGAAELRQEGLID